MQPRPPSKRASSPAAVSPCYARRGAPESPTRKSASRSASYEDPYSSNLRLRRVHFGPSGGACVGRPDRCVDVDLADTAVEVSEWRAIVGVGSGRSRFGERGAERGTEHFPRRDEERGQDRPKNEAHRAKEHESAER